jgi:sugar phosphate isomerase/epimerase
MSSMCTGSSGTATSDGAVSQLDRRHFLTAAAATAAAIGGVSSLAAPASADERGGPPARHRVPRDQISLQLFTLRNQLAADFAGTIAALAAIGYRRVEHAGFVGRTVQEFKSVTDANGIWVSSGHVLIPQPFNTAAWNASLQDALTLGSKYIVQPFFGINFATGEVVRDTATWAAFARDLNQAGRMAREVGLRLGYHNHNWEFFTLTDNPRRTAYDVLIEETDPRYVHFEMDLFWVTRGARDPVDLLRRLRSRVRQYHVKDMNQAGSFTDPGTGLVDFPRIFRSARSVDEYIVERDDAGSPPRTPPMALDTARVGFDYLANVRF